MEGWEAKQEVRKRGKETGMGRRGRETKVMGNQERGEGYGSVERSGARRTAGQGEVFEEQRAGGRHGYCRHQLCPWVQGPLGRG